MSAPVTPSPPAKGRKAWLRPVRWLLAGLSFLGRALVVGWGTLALYYSNLPWPSLRLAMAAVFAAFGAWTLRRAFRARRLAVFATLLAAVAVWHVCIPPSHDRHWRREVAVMPRAIVDGDHVRLTGVRDFEYRTVSDFTERYVEREVSLERLNSVDLYVSYWMPGPVAHTFVSFNFDDAPPVCISIETRPEEGELYAPVASMFKQFELIYVVGEERDLVRVRTDHRAEEVYLYPIRATPEGARRMFLVYLDRINEMADQPEWYHLLKSNCSLNIVRYANAAGRTGPWDFRHYLNGWIDRYLYQTGAVDTSLPFDELRRRSRITEAAQAAGDDPLEFSRSIRASLPGAR